MAFQKNSETDLFIAASGQQYILSRPPSRYVMSEEGTGMPPIDYVTQRGPYQHGESLRDFFLTPRTVQMIVRHNYCDREDYWAGRNELLNVLTPNLGAGSTLATGTLRKSMPGGIVRDLTCIIDQGPKFEPRDPSQWDEFSYTETLRFIAHNPIYFDPTQKTFTFVNTTDELVFPITFPITFGDGAIHGTLVYAGNWPEYPTIVVSGPLSLFTITNVTTGKTLTLDYDIPDAAYVTFSLSYGAKTITQNDGTNLIGYLTPDSDLVGFQLIPGNNELTVSSGDFGPIVPRTMIQIFYFDRFIGI